MKALIFLGAVFLLLLPTSGSAETQTLADDLQNTLAEIELTQEKVTRLQSLVDSLASQQTTYAGYGLPRTNPDLARVRKALFETMGHYNELVARKLYLQHRISTGEAAQPSESAPTHEVLENKPTRAPENCPLGAVNFQGQWHCVRKESKNEVPAAPKPSQCELGTVELHGQSYCLGKEPGGALVQEASNDFLGPLLASPQQTKKAETAPVYRMK